MVIAVHGIYESKLVTVFYFIFFFLNITAMHRNGPLPQVSMPKLKKQHLHIICFSGKKSEPDSEKLVCVSLVLGICQL